MSAAKSRWGVIATSWIAEDFVIRAVRACGDELVAVVSRDSERTRTDAATLAGGSAAGIALAVAEMPSVLTSMCLPPVLLRTRDMGRTGAHAASGVDRGARLLYRDRNRGHELAGSVPRRRADWDCDAGASPLLGRPRRKEAGLGFGCRPVRAGQVSRRINRPVRSLDHLRRAGAGVTRQDWAVCAWRTRCGTDLSADHGLGKVQYAEPASLVIRMLPPSPMVASVVYPPLVGIVSDAAALVVGIAVAGLLSVASAIVIAHRAGGGRIPHA